MTHLRTLNFIRMTTALLLLLLLAACCRTSCTEIIGKERDADTCSYCSAPLIDRTTIEPNWIETEDELLSDNINVVHLGDYRTLVIPAEMIFFPRSPKIKPQARSTLELIEHYLSLFDTVTIHVDVYTALTGDPFRNRALSQTRAESIIDFMGRDNVDTRLLVARGFGGALPIATNTTHAGRNTNNRIEMSFKIYNSERMYVS